MSNKNKISWAIIVLILVLSFCPAWSNDDDILTFYTRRAGEVYPGRNPFDAGISFSFQAKTYYKVLDDNSRYVLIDSTESIYYYSFGERDSISVLLTPKEQFDSLPLEYPDIFVDDYIFNFFPNDTGSRDLSIGFDTPTLDTLLPVGFAVIDRNLYYYRYLYLYYLHPTRFKRHSLGYRFIEYEGMIFPDSIWTLQNRRHLFSAEYYRYETKLSDFTIYR